MSGCRVVVAGAGIGGLTAALALSGIGCEVTLVERRTGFTEPGAGIQISPNASRVLMALGLEAPLRRASVAPDRIVIRDAGSGRTIGAVALGRYAAARYGAPYLVAQRSDLQTLLLDAVRSRGIPLLMGRRATAAAEVAGRAVLSVETARGESQNLVGDLAVGADGLWSASRDALGCPPPAPAGYCAWRSVVPRAHAPPGLTGNETGLWLGRRVHVVHYPIAGGELINIVAILRGAHEAEGWSAPGESGAIRSLFSRAAPVLRDLISAGDDWRVWSLHDAAAGPAARGRLALIGDAAHPVLPFLAQGGALAIEDAAALAAALAASGFDIPAATHRYAEARLPRIRRVQKAARRNGRLYHLGGPLAWGRNLVMQRLGPERMTARYDWLYGWRTDDAPPSPA